MGNRRSADAILAGLVLFFWANRLINLDDLAFFLDEANHLWWARLVWDLQPFIAASDGRLLNVLWMAAFWPFNAGVWLSRASVVLVAVAGFACLIDFARRAFSPRAAVMAGLLYTFMPLTFFYERMALADSLSPAFVAGALWALYNASLARASKAALFWSALAGIALSAGVLCKISNLIFLGFPLAACILFPLANWRRAVTVAAASLGAMLASLWPSVWVLQNIGKSDLGLDLLTFKAGASQADLAAQLSQNLILLAEYVAVYLPFPLWPALALGIVAALWARNRAAWFTIGVLAATVCIFVWRTTPAYLESRFLPAYAPLLAAGAGAGLAALTKPLRPIWVGALLGLVLSSGLAFSLEGYTRSEWLALHARDRWQYITGWPSGYGFREIAAEVADRTTPLDLVTLDLGGRERLEGYLFGRNNLITPIWYSPGESFDNGWLLLDLPKDNDEIAKLGLTIVEMARYPRPDGESAVVVFRVEP